MTTETKRITELEQRMKKLEAELRSSRKIATQIHFYLKKLRDAVLATDGSTGAVVKAAHKVAKQSGQIATGD